MEGSCWGYHLVLDLKGCNKEVVCDEAKLADFTKDLVHRIGMKAYGSPILKHFATHNPEAAGYSLLQLIETSNIAGHFVDKNGDAYLDIFSCKSFSIEEVIAVVEEHLQPQHTHHQLIKRGAAPLVASDDARVDRCRL